MRAILKTHVPDCKVFVFGSCVKGNAAQFSDLDLAVKGKKELDLKVLADLKDDFSESNLPFKVDVLNRNVISNDFQAHIINQYDIIQTGTEND